MYRLSFYVPIKDSEKVKKSVFSAGAGQIGCYDNCCWETKGVGQFRPLPGSNPAIGRLDEIERVQELKVEMVCSDEHIKKAVVALKQAHPYEEPAYEVYKLEDF